MFQLPVTSIELALRLACRAVLHEAKDNRSFYLLSISATLQRYVTLFALLHLSKLPYMTQMDSKEVFLDI